MSGLEPNDAAWETLKAALAARAEVEKIDGEPMFLGRPDRWYEAAWFRCEHGHVTGMVLKSEELGRDACLSGQTKPYLPNGGPCLGRLLLTFPEDETGPMATIPIPCERRRR